MSASSLKRFCQNTDKDSLIEKKILLQVILYCSVSGNYPVILSISLLSCQNTSEQKEVKDPAKDPQYAEPQIDAMRAQKDQVTQLNQSHARSRYFVAAKW